MAAVRPSILTLVPFLVTLMDAMRSMDVSVSRASYRLLVRFLFPSHVTLTVLVCVMANRLDPFLCHAYVFSLMLSICLRRKRFILAGLRYAQMFTGRLVSCPCRFFLRPVFYPSIITYPTGRYSRLVLLQFLRLFVLVSY